MLGLMSEIERFRKFRQAVYTCNLARTATKLWENVFQTIPDVSFFDAKNFFSAKFSDEKFRFLWIWHGFGRATAKRTSKSACVKFCFGLTYPEVCTMKFDGKTGFSRLEQPGPVTLLAHYTFADTPLLKCRSSRR